MPPGRGSNSSADVERLERVRTWLGDQVEAIIDEQVELACIAAPPFAEGARAEAIVAKLAPLGIDVTRDEIGNVLAWYPAGGEELERPPVILAAHIDTVFAPDTPIEIRRQGDRWIGPGITDNARGLAVTLAVLRALIRAEIATRTPILFAFTVGEEGRGDLRGVKHLLREGSPLCAATAFIAVDGSGLRRIIHHALGSRRFRVIVTGAGGHSWTDWGRSNPANAIGEFIHRLSELALPRAPRTTLTVARLGGGTSINAIPADSWVELDLRSEANDALSSLERLMRDALAASVRAEEERGDGRLAVELEIIGERPAGALPVDHPLVRAAEAATRALGVDPEYAVSSTDANVPQALGIPAVALGAGGRSGDTHTLNEWFEDSDGAAGAQRLLAILAATCGF